MGAVALNGWMYFLARGSVLLRLNFVLLMFVGSKPILKAVLLEKASLFEFSAACLYIAITLLSGVFEESVKPSFLWEIVVSADGNENIENIGRAANDHNVILNAVGVFLTVLSLASLPEFLRAICDRAHKDDSLLVQAADKQNGNNRSGEGSVQVSENRAARQQGNSVMTNLIAGDNAWLKGSLNAVSVIVLTFKFLLWKGQIEAGEYYALGCRIVHAVAAVLFFFTF